MLPSGSIQVKRALISASQGVLAQLHPNPILQVLP